MSELKSVQPRWFKATVRRSELLFVSDVFGWVSHWDVSARRSRKCGGRSCGLCSFGYPKVARFVVVAVDQWGTDWLVELRERHREFIERLREGRGTAAGARVVVCKEGEALNSAVCFTLLGREPVVIRDISRLVDSLGLPAITVRSENNIGEITSAGLPLLGSCDEVADPTE